MGDRAHMMPITNVSLSVTGGHVWDRAHMMPITNVSLSVTGGYVGDRAHMGRTVHQPEKLEKILLNQVNLLMTLNEPLLVYYISYV